MKDGETVRFGLNDRFGSAPIVVRDGASLPGSQGQGQALTDEQKAEIAWIEMGRWLGDQWRAPAPQAHRSPARDQGAAAQDQAAWASSGHAPVVHASAGSAPHQATQDEDPAAAAHRQMVHELCAAWKTSPRSWK